MYATLVKVRINPARAQEAAQTFAGSVLPRVRAAQGFRGGYWLEPENGEGFGMALFETGKQARRMADPAAWEAPGVMIEGIGVRRVALAI